MNFKLKCWISSHEEKFQKRNIAEAIEGSTGWKQSWTGIFMWMGFNIEGYVTVLKILSQVRIYLLSHVSKATQVGTGKVDS